MIRQVANAANNGTQSKGENAMCATGHRVNSILTHLQQVREDLFSLAEDILLSADPHVNEELRHTLEFLTTYNDKVEEFSRAATVIETILHDFMTPAEETTTETIAGWTPRERRERIIRSMDKREPHSLDEDFTYKRPYAFSLGDSVYRETNTWRKVLDTVCRQLASTNRQKFLGLSGNQAFTSNQGKPWISSNPASLRIALDVSNGIYAECNLSANDTRKLILRLLEAFGIAKDDCIVFLREDRDAESTVAA